MARRSVSTSENQLKVIRDKYLRDSPSVAAWLDGVAANVALGEVLLSPHAEKWGAFKGVSSRRRLTARLFHAGLHRAEAREANFERLLSNLRRAVVRYPAAKRLHEKYRRRFFDLMADWVFLPNSPTLMNAGRELQQLSACYVLPVPDSMEGINAALCAQSIIQKSGGGTGFAFSLLRPNGDPVRKTSGVASGPLSFMRLFDTMTAVVKQGGARRGANMGVLHYTHPDIRAFVQLKAQPGVMENFNISVAIDAAFMKAVDQDAEYDLINPRTGKPTGRERARALFELIAKQAWSTGDPGLLVLDRINASTSNPTPLLGEITATNPCGEQPLLDWEPCNLGSLNLAKFIVAGPEKATLDRNSLRAAVADALRFLDDVIEVNNYPLQEIEALAKGNRRVGLGVMGYAEALVKLGLAYDSNKALDFAEDVMKEIDGAALLASETLARERGVFPNWKKSIYDPKGPHFLGRSAKPRHCARTTIAPTGTIALAAGLQGAGIEPFFGVAYTRMNARALEQTALGRTPDSADVFIEVNPLFREIAAARDFFGLKKSALWDKVAQNSGRVRGLPEISADVQALFPTAHDVSIHYHVATQAAFQRHVDNGVSKTINLPASATAADVAGAYRAAYESGCKGITVYRDGSKAQQVLNLPAPACPRCL